MEIAESDTVQAWLDLQCRMVAGITRAVVLLKGGSSSEYQLAAFWANDISHSSGPEIDAPAAGNIQKIQLLESKLSEHLIQVGKRAINEHRRVLEHEFKNSSTEYQIIAYPVFVNGELAGAFAIQLTHRAEAQLQAAMQVFTWTAAWLEILLRYQSARVIKRHQNLVDVIAQAVTRENFSDSATAVVIILANQLRCSRVTLGLLHNRELRISAMSYSVMLDEKNNLIRKIISAMHEAIDQRKVIAYPEIAKDESDEEYANIVLAHKALSDDLGGASVCSLPLIYNQSVIGALTLERAADNPLDQDAVSEVETLTTIIGPVLGGKYQTQRSVLSKLHIKLKAIIENILGPKKLTAKIIIIACLLVLTLTSVIKTDYRIVAKANLEGSIQRAIVSPIEGFLVDAYVKAGDIVEVGQVLGQLDDKDLKLEQIKWSSEKAQLLRSQREALAKHDRSESNIIRAQLDQAEAELSLVQEKLSRTKLMAPISGLVVSGDFSQSLGMPLERGQLLFEIAPLNSYRIMLNIDEREVGFVEQGQSGLLVLSSLPLEKFGFVVERILPVSVAADGENYFQVEASLIDAPEKLRPGMSGIAKVNAGEYPMIWTWTHSLFNTIRLMSWKWLP